MTSDTSDTSPPQVTFLTVEPEQHGQRLDNLLITVLKGLPKSALYKVIRTGQVRVNKGRAKPTTRVMAGDVVRIPPLRLSEREAPATPSAALLQDLELRVLFDDAGLLIIDKPAGLAVHGGSGVSLGAVEALRQSPLGGPYLELVHRLDRDTSGCLMLARKRSVLKHCQDLLRARRGVAKDYEALAEGVWPEQLQQVVAPLERYLLPNGERRVKVAADGKPALTRFQVLEQLPRGAHIRASPITGRTHQIRVHALAAGHPLIGDDKYGAARSVLPAAGLCLHARRLRITLADGREVDVAAPLPAAFLRNLAALRAACS